jgi:hypothetical protein
VVSPDLHAVLRIKNMAERAAANVPEVISLQAPEGSYAAAYEAAQAYVRLRDEARRLNARAGWSEQDFDRELPEPEFGHLPHPTEVGMRATSLAATLAELPTEPLPKRPRCPGADTRDEPGLEGAEAPCRRLTRGTPRPAPSTRISTYAAASIGAGTAGPDARCLGAASAAVTGDLSAGGRTDGRLPRWRDRARGRVRGRVDRTGAGASEPAPRRPRGRACGPRYAAPEFARTLRRLAGGC